MPATTPTYGITYPVSTDKVADGAAAIQSTAETVERELTAIDTRTNNAVTSKVDKAGGDTITASAATVIPLTIKGAASQSADLLRATDNAGTVVLRIASNGYFTGRRGAFVSDAANGVVLQVQGAASQTSNLIECLDSAGTVKARVGGVAFDVAADGGFFGGAGATSIFARNAFTTEDASLKPLVVRGAASQTAKLIEAQYSNGTRQFEVDANGRVGVNLSSLAGPQAAIMSIPLGTAEPGLVVRGLAAQTANLTEWQNSAGTVLAAIEASGRFRFPGIVVTTARPSGTAAALPAQPHAYLEVNVDGTTRYIPYYA